MLIRDDEPRLQGKEKARQRAAGLEKGYSEKSCLPLLCLWFRLFLGGHRPPSHRVSKLRVRSTSCVPTRFYPHYIVFKKGFVKKNLHPCHRSSAMGCHGRNSRTTLNSRALSPSLLLVMFDHLLNSLVLLTFVFLQERILNTWRMSRLPFLTVRAKNSPKA